MKRNPTQLVALIDDSAYSDKPVFGETCQGWLRRGMPVERARQTVTNYLIGVANSYPAGTSFTDELVNLSTAEWASYAVNDVRADRYILMRVDAKSIKDMFRGNKAYRNVLERHLKNGPPLYWSVFGILLPDQDALVVYAVWQRVRDNWYVTGVDVTCPGI